MFKLFKVIFKILVYLFAIIGLYGVTMALIDFNSGTKPEVDTQPKTVVIKRAVFDKNNLDIEIGTYDEARKLYRYNEHLFIRNYTEEKMVQANFPEDLKMDYIMGYNHRYNGDYAVLDIDKYLRVIEDKSFNTNLALSMALEGPSVAEEAIEGLKDDNFFNLALENFKESFKSVVENWDTIFNLIAERVKEVLKVVVETFKNTAEQSQTQFILMR